MPSGRLTGDSVVPMGDHGRASGREPEGPPTGGSTGRSPLRTYEPADRAALYDICLRTGDGGGDASGHYAVPTLLGEVYVGPYVAFEPELAFVLDDGTGVGGYTLGALDTRAFEARCEREWWPQLRQRHPRGSQRPGSADAGVVALLHQPPRVPDAVVAGHPSHLHIDLLPPWQGGGWGRRLIDRLLVALEELGSPGVHLGVSTGNPRAVGFYRHLGFTQLHAEDDTLFLGRSLL
jgi:ribosomal protein S18 acetylase RimI-like enzyme